MTYQAPAFMVGHKISARPIASLTPRNANTLSDDSKRAMMDFRQGTFGSFTSDGVNSGIEIDFGSSLNGGSFNRFVIPAGHGFEGVVNLQIISDTTAGMATPTVHSSGSVDDTNIIDRSFTLFGLERYWGFQIVESLSAPINLSELWLGKRKTLTAGDGRVDPGFLSSYEHDLSQDEYGGRTATLELSPARRRYSLTVIRLDPANDDYATLDEVIRQGRTNPFWYWPPDTTDPGPHLVRLTRASRRRNDTSIPTTSIKYRVDIEMLEELT